MKAPVAAEVRTIWNRAPSYAPVVESATARRSGDVPALRCLVGSDRQRLGRVARISGSFRNAGPSYSSTLDPDDAPEVERPRRARIVSHETSGMVTSLPADAGVSYNRGMAPCRGWW